MKIKTLEEIMTAQQMDKEKGITLTKKDMYDEEGNSKLPKVILRRYAPRHDYLPHQSTKEKLKRIKNV